MKDPYRFSFRLMPFILSQDGHAAQGGGELTVAAAWL
jgi:hypothetical protein